MYPGSLVFDHFDVLQLNLKSCEGIGGWFVQPTLKKKLAVTLRCRRRYRSFVGCVLFEHLSTTWAYSALFFSLHLIPPVHSILLHSPFPHTPFHSFPSSFACYHLRRLHTTPSLPAGTHSPSLRGHVSREDIPHSGGRRVGSLTTRRLSRWKRCESYAPAGGPCRPKARFEPDDTLFRTM